MEKAFLLAIDQGTTGTKVLLLDRSGEVVAQSYTKHTQFYPQEGWVEHDPEEIWQAVCDGVREVLRDADASPKHVVSVGLANQGETVMWWDGVTHRPLYPAVVWSCRRSREIAEQWENDGDWNTKVAEKTGLRIDPYFSATKIRWMLDNVASVQQAASEGSAKAGTLDSWLIWKITAGKRHVTDTSTAARTLLFNIHNADYDDEILAYLNINRDWLPQIADSVQSGRSSVSFGVTDPDAFLGIAAPITVSLVDQPAALFGHLCVEPGAAKVTYGTGCFAYMNTGSHPPVSKHNLLSTVVWSEDGAMTFALDGGVYSAGSSIDWANRQLELFDDTIVLQEWSMARLNTDRRLSEIKVFYVPALSGLGAPYWDSYARGSFVGMSFTTAKEDLAMAILEGVAHRVADVLEAMEMDSGRNMTVLKADGGLTNNPYIMQFQADLLGIPVEVPALEEVTAMGVGYMLGVAQGWWTREQLRLRAAIKQRYEPSSTPEERQNIRKRWKQIVEHVRQMPIGPDQTIQS